MFAASNPAEVKVEIVHFLKCDRKDLIILGGAVLLAVGLVFVNWKVSLIVAGIGLAVPVMSIFTAKQVFADGDVLPAVVVDAERGLVAVLADLSTSREPVWAVKVLAQPLGRVTGGPFEDGKRLAFVAMYNGQPGSGAWNNFGGYIVNTGTTNKKAIRRVLESIPDEQWSRLKKGLRKLDEPYSKGLERL